MKNNLFDKVIVSSDDRPDFLNFWPIVSNAWQKYFQIKPILALVSDVDKNDAFIAKLEQYGEVHVLPKIKGIPVQNLAKIARFIVASRLEDSICMIEDIDTIPLQSKFVENLVLKRETGKILAVGHEVYAGGESSGKFPVSNITSEGYNFKKLFNPNNLEYEELVNSLINIKVVDHRENISNTPNNFSDESLIRALIIMNKLDGIVQKVERGVNAKSDWIDRSWWRIDENKLRSDGYVICNFIRPFKKNVHMFTPIIHHIYGYHPSDEELFVK